MADCPALCYFLLGICFNTALDNCGIKVNLFSPCWNTEFLNCRNHLLKGSSAISQTQSRLSYTGGCGGITRGRQSSGTVTAIHRPPKTGTALRPFGCTKHALFHVRTFRSLFLFQRPTCARWLTGEHLLSPQPHGGWRHQVREGDLALPLGSFLAFTELLRLFSPSVAHDATSAPTTALQIKQANRIYTASPAAVTEEAPWGCSAD